MDKKLSVIHFRLTEYEKNRIRGLADLYADGDMSIWLRWAALNAERMVLVKPKRKTPARRPQRGKKKVRKTKLR